MKKLKKRLKKILKSTGKITILEIPITSIYIADYAGIFLTNMMIGRIYNKKQLAATGLIATTKTFLDTGKNLQTSLNSYIKAAETEQEKYLVGGIAQQGLFIGVITSAACMLVACQIKPILLCFGQDEAILQNVDDFYKSYLWSFPAILVLNGAKQFAQAAGAPYSAAVLSVVSSSLNVCLGYILIVGIDIEILKIPGMGLFGMGLAYSIQSWISCISYLLYLSINKEIIPYKLLYPRLISTLKYLPKLFFTGIPIAIYVGSQKLCGIVLSLIVGSMHNSKDMLSTYSIQNQYHYIFLFPSFCLVNTLSILITNVRKKSNLSGKDIKEIKRIGNIGIFMGLSYSSLLLGASFFSSDLLTYAFIDIHDPENRRIVHYTRILLPLAMTDAIFVSLYEATIGNLLGLTKVSIPALNSIFGSWCLTIPIAFLFKNATMLDVLGIAVAQILGSFTTAGLNLLTWSYTSSNLSVESIKKNEQKPTFLQSCYKKLPFFFCKKNTTKNAGTQILISDQNNINISKKERKKVCAIL